MEHTLGIVLLELGKGYDSLSRTVLPRLGDLEPAGQKIKKQRCVRSASDGVPDLIALGQIGDRRVFPQHLQCNLRLQRRVDLPSCSLRHSPLGRLRRNGPKSNYYSCHLRSAPGVHFSSTWTVTTP
jgi:hypothetical protein